MEQVYDPWTVPQPKMLNNSSQVKLDTRYIWFGLLHITDYPVEASDIHTVCTALGYSVVANKIGQIMAKTCMRGYFTRKPYHKNSAGPYYKYKPTNLFTMIQDKWRKEVN